MRLCPPRVLAFLAYGLSAALGCAGAGTGGVTAGSAGKGGSSNTGAAGTSSSGSAGTTGGGGTSSSGDAGATGNGGSVGSGAGGTTGAAAGTGTGGITAGQAGTTGSAGTTGAAGTTSSGSAGTTGAAGTGGICQQAQLVYEPKIPTVYLVVDRSGSMFHCLSTSQCVCATKTDTSWSTLKSAIETVLTQLDGQVRFGFTTIFGTDPSMSRGGMCPLINGTLADNVAPALNNAAAIKTLYDGLAWPVESECQTSGKKFESPAMYAITAATKALTAITAP